jgi:hypothetical protein
MSRTRRVVQTTAAVALLAFVFAAGWLVARTGLGRAVDPATLPEVERRFIEQMQGAALVGRFTMAGREDRAAVPDRYDIYGVDKLGADEWRFNAKIGETGLTVPVVVTMRFVDDTPLILMTNATIPGMGVGFSARVFFYGDLYAGTWAHGGDRGGHLFGRIERHAAQK